MESPLCGRVLGEGPAVLFVHGLGASHQFWGNLFDRLALRHRLGMVDLAGFAGSMRCPGPFDAASHAERVLAFGRAHLGPGPYVVVGHSFGALVALAASRAPEVEGVVAIGAPVFDSPAQGRAHLSRLGVLERWLATRSRKAELACRIFCRKAWMKPVVPLLFPDLPRAVAQQGLMHTYEAYAEAFNDMLDADVRGWLAARPVPRLFVHGTRDRYCTPGDLERILGVTALAVEGDHGLPFRAPEACLTAIERFLATLPTMAAVGPSPEAAAV